MVRKGRMAGMEPQLLGRAPGTHACRAPAAAQAGGSWGMSSAAARQPPRCTQCTHPIAARLGHALSLQQPEPCLNMGQARRTSGESPTAQSHSPAIIEQEECEHGCRGQRRKPRSGGSPSPAGPGAPRSSPVDAHTSCSDRGLLGASPLSGADKRHAAAPAAPQAPPAIAFRFVG